MKTFFQCEVFIILSVNVTHGQRFRKPSGHQQHVSEVYLL